jgi:plasmid stabilization system protein ParE
MNIVWSPLAVARIEEIADYIADESIEASNHWIDGIFDTVEQLSKFPDSGRIVPEVNRYDIRELIYGNYRIVYRSSHETVSILTVRHTKQILPTDEIMK